MAAPKWLNMLPACALRLAILISSRHNYGHRRRGGRRMGREEGADARHGESDVEEARA